MPRHLRLAIPTARLVPQQGAVLPRSYVTLKQRRWLFKRPVVTQVFLVLVDRDALGHVTQRGVEIGRCVGVAVGTKSTGPKIIFEFARAAIGRYRLYHELMFSGTRG